jgi:hypothetical protein
MKYGFEVFTKSSRNWSYNEKIIMDGLIITESPSKMRGYGYIVIWSKTSYAIKMMRLCKYFHARLKYYPHKVWIYQRSS